MCSRQLSEYIFNELRDSIIADRKPKERPVLEVEHALRYTSALAWIIAIGAACFTVGLLVGHSADESGNYGIYVLVSTIVATAALVTAIFLTISTANRLRRGRSRPEA